MVYVKSVVSPKGVRYSISWVDNNEVVTTPPWLKANNGVIYVTSNRVCGGYDKGASAPTEVEADMKKFINNLGYKIV